MTTLAVGPGFDAQVPTIIDPLMGMLRVCTADGCETKTLGLYCVDHEATNAGEDVNEALRSAIYDASATSEPPPLKRNA